MSTVYLYLYIYISISVSIICTRYFDVEADARPQGGPLGPPGGCAIEASLYHVLAEKILSSSLMT